MAFAHDGNAMATAGITESVTLWDTHDPSRVQQMRSLSSSVTDGYDSVAFTAVGAFWPLPTSRVRSRCGTCGTQLELTGCHRP